MCSLPFCEQSSNINEGALIVKWLTSLSSSARLSVTPLTSVHALLPFQVLKFPERLSWPWSYGSWIYNNLCNPCLSPLMLWVWISIRTRCTILCDKVCLWLSTGRWFSLDPPVSSTNKTDCHDIAEILLKVALNTINQKTNKISRRLPMAGNFTFIYHCFKTKKTFETTFVEFLYIISYLLQENGYYVRKVTKSLLSISKKRSYLQQICYNAVCLIVKQVNKDV
jgi:hypothetical protein